jgi:hypothetical protein
VVEGLLCQRIPRPSETVTSPLTHWQIPAEVHSMGRSDMGTEHPRRMSGRGALQSCPPRAKDPGPCRSRRSPPHSLRTFWYVLLELTLLRSSASPQDRLSLPREPESGSLSPLFHCFPPDNFIPGFPCPHPTQGSPHSQMDDLVTSVQPFPHPEPASMGSVSCEPCLVDRVVLFPREYIHPLPVFRFLFWFKYLLPGLHSYTLWLRFLSSSSYHLPNYEENHHAKWSQTVRT